MNCETCDSMKVTIPIKKGKFRYREATARCVNENGLLNHEGHFKGKVFTIGISKSKKGYTEWAVYGELCRLHSKK